MLRCVTGRTKSVYRVFKYHPLIVAFAVPLRFDAVTANRSFLPTFDPSSPTSCTVEISKQESVSTHDPNGAGLMGQSLLRQPVFVRFRDILGLWVDMLLTGTSSGRDPSGRRLVPFWVMAGPDSPLLAMLQSPWERSVGKSTDPMDIQRLKEGSTTLSLKEEAEVIWN